MEQCDSGLILKPTDYYLKLNKVRALLDLKEKDRAQSLIQDFLIDETKYPPAIDLYLIKLFEKHKMKTETLDILAKYSNSSPKLFYPFAKIAITRLDKGDPIKAKFFLLDGMNKTAIYDSKDFLPDIRSPILKIDFRNIAKELTKKARASMNMELVATAKAMLILQGNTHDHSSKSLNEAKKILKEVIKKDKKIYHAYLILGIISLRQKDYKNAEEMLKKTLEMDINNLPAGIALGIVHRSLKRYDSSINLLTEALSDEGMKFIALFELGQTKQYSGDIANAMDYYSKAFTLQDNFYPVILKYFNLEL